MEMEAIITGNVVFHRKSAKKGEACVHTILQSLPDKLKSITRLEIDILRNNSFLIRVGDIHKTLRVALAVRLLFKANELDVRLAMFIDTLDTQSLIDKEEPFLLETDCPKDTLLSIKIFRKDFQEEFGVTIVFVDEMISSWTSRQCQIMFERLVGEGNFTEIGKRLGVSRQYVSKTLKDCREDMIKLYIDRFEQLVTVKTDLNYWYWKKHTEESSKFYINKMKELTELMGGDITKIRGELRGEATPNHLMYKLPSLEWPDNPDVYYEFLIEYDIMEPHVGIYYGVKCVSSLDFNHDEAIRISEEHWKTFKEEIITILNNVFIHKDFTHRFKKTNNANDNTYWPFWITLNEDEDIQKIGLVALKIIRAVYNNKLYGTNSESPIKLKGIIPKTECETRYTEEAYYNLQKKLEEAYVPNAKKNRTDDDYLDRDYAREVINLIDRSVGEGWLTKANIPGVPYGYKFTYSEATDKDFTTFWIALLTYVDSKLQRKRKNIRPCWDAASYLFLNKDNEGWTGNKLRSMYSGRDSIPTEEGETEDISVQDWIERFEKLKPTNMQHEGEIPPNF